MPASLGWRDSGQVLLSKADAERRKGDEQRGEDTREVPVFQGAVMSRRQWKAPQPRRFVETEEVALETELHIVLGKKPETRLKWFQKALRFTAMKKVKVGVIYDIMRHRRFLSDIRPRIGSQMKALLLANLHLFSPKQQRHLDSESSGYLDFPDTVSKESEGKRRAESRDRRGRSRKRTKHSGSGSTSSDESGSGAKDTVGVAAHGAAAHVDPRIYSCGAADDL
mmetsp:Transcript_99517/g.192183  ORF Transcript_99517/g.192183 Transcript_99517/m.192183 type:complete len:224 (+) Transcript_99517:52-723(+)